MPVRFQDKASKPMKQLVRDPAKMTDVVQAGLNVPEQWSLECNTDAAKLLQTEQGAGWVLEHEDELWTVILDQPSVIQNLESTKAPLLLQAWTRTIGTTPAVEPIGHKAHFACGDRHPSNARAERDWSVERPGWTHYLADCESHIQFSIFKAVFFELVQPDVRGLIWTALSVQHGALMKAFRECLAEEIRDTLDILEGAPSEEARRFSEQVHQALFRDLQRSLSDNRRFVA